MYFSVCFITFKLSVALSIMANDTGRKSLPIFTVDAFASQPFTGNPAAVCPIPSAKEVTSLPAGSVICFPEAARCGVVTVP